MENLEYCIELLKACNYDEDKARQIISDFNNQIDSTMIQHLTTKVNYLVKRNHELEEAMDILHPILQKVKHQNTLFVAELEKVKFKLRIDPKFDSLIYEIDHLILNNK